MTNQTMINKSSRAKCSKLDTVSIGKLATPEGVDAIGHLSIRFKLVLVLGVGHHSLRIIQYSATVGETAFKD